MPPFGGKGKGKGSRDHRRSISRNTTPSSIGAGAAQASIGGPPHTAYLDIPLADLNVSTKVTYEDLLERIGSGTGIPDSEHLKSIAEDLRILSANAEVRGFACDKGMRELAARRKRKVEEDRERERAMEEKKEKMRREALAEEEDEELRGRKMQKIKKRKDVSKAREERTLAHGAHVSARQDGVQQDGKGEFSLPSCCLLKNENVPSSSPHKISLSNSFHVLASVTDTAPISMILPSRTSLLRSLVFLSSWVSIYPGFVQQRSSNGLRRSFNLVSIPCLNTPISYLRPFASSFEPIKYSSLLRQNWVD
jgi:hypothetical protein